MAKGGNGKGQVVETGTGQDDILTAAADTTKINGGDGNDYITGGDQVDDIRAGDGDDTISGGAGDDTIFGNDGTDTAMIADLSSLSIEAGKGNSWIASSTDGTDTLKHIEMISDGTFTYTVGENNGVFGLGTAAATDEDNATSIDVLAAAFDVEGDAFSVSSVDATSASGASVSINEDGTVGYNPGDLFQALAANETATDTFSYTVTDAAGNETTATMTVTIEGVNDAPVVTGGDTAGSVGEDDVLTATGSVTATDVDASDELSWSGGGEGAYGSLSIDADGNWTYTLDNESEAVQALNTGDTVQDSFTVTVDDGNGGSAEETITVDIAGANDGIVNEDGEEVSTDFENGFTGWDTIGWTSVVASNTGVGNMARIDGNGASEAAIESFFGASISNAYQGTVGSAIKTTLELNAGDTVSFDYFFQANDYMPYNDFAIFMGTDGSMQILSNVATVGNYGNSGWQTVELSIETDGVYDIGFAAMNARDTILWPQLYVDNLEVA